MDFTTLKKILVEIEIMSVNDPAAVPGLVGEARNEIDLLEESHLFPEGVNGPEGGKITFTADMSGAQFQKAADTAKQEHDIDVKIIEQSAPDGTMQGAAIIDALNDAPDVAKTPKPKTK